MLLSHRIERFFQWRPPCPINRPNSPQPIIPAAGQIIVQCEVGGGYQVKAHWHPPVSRALAWSEGVLAFSPSTSYGQKI
jgi:hypothetical protein